MEESPQHTKRLFHLVFVSKKVTEVVIMLQIRHIHVSASHYFISEIPEFGLPKLRNFGMYKRPEIQEFRNSEILELQSLVAIFTDTRVCIGLHATTDKEKDKQIGRYSSSKGKRTRSQVFFFKKKLCDIGPNQNL